MRDEIGLQFEPIHKTSPLSLSNCAHGRPRSNLKYVSSPTESTFCGSVNTQQRPRRVRRPHQSSEAKCTLTKSVGKNPTFKAHSASNQDGSIHRHPPFIRTIHVPRATAAREHNRAGERASAADLEKNEKNKKKMPRAGGPTNERDGLVQGGGDQRISGIGCSSLHR